MHNLYILSINIQWRFIWTMKEKLYDKLLELNEIKMRTAEIYFRKDPKLVLPK